MLLHLALARIGVCTLCMRAVMYFGFFGYAFKVVVWSPPLGATLRVWPPDTPPPPLTRARVCVCVCSCASAGLLLVDLSFHPCGEPDDNVFAPDWECIVGVHLNKD
jgi:hypothetical protein